jgi:superfamily II DNA helicase RecQ
MQTPTATADTTDCLTDLTGTTTVAAEAMQSVFGMSPHGWQEEMISHIIALFKNNSCAPLLLVRPTGAGKSAVRDTVGVIFAGVILTISPLLSLAADQANKVGSRASQEFGNVLSFHLDEIRDRDEQLAVAASISNMASETTQTVFLFASPQVFVNNPTWQKPFGRNYPEEVATICCGR